MSEVRDFAFSDSLAFVPERRAAGGFARVRSFAGKAFLTVTDQALFSGANFVANILLARWLTADGYGAYSLAYAVFLFFLAAYMAVMIEPMVIFGAGRYDCALGQYLKTLLRMHGAAIGPLSVLLVFVALVISRFYSVEAGRALLGVAIGGGMILLYWMVRRIFYVVADPRRSVFGSALYFVALTGSVALLKITGALTALSTLIGMGVASLLTSALLLWVFLRSTDTDSPGPGFREALREHWGYGRWALASAALAWFPGQIYYAVLPVWLGLSGSAALRALTNFAMPVLQSISALNLLLLPALVRDRHKGGRANMNRTIVQYLAIFSAGCLLYMLVLWVFRSQAFQLFYGGRYSEYRGLPFLLAGLLPVGTCLSAVLGNALRAIERPDRMFQAYIGSAIMAAVAGLPLAMRFGVTGALAGIHLSSFALVGVLWWFWRSARIHAKGGAA